MLDSVLPAALSIDIADILYLAPKLPDFRMSDAQMWFWGA
jgi:hypothetical protein